MPKIYSEDSVQMNNLKPKKETLDFLLNYSKALKVLKIKNINVEIIQN